MPRSIQSIVEEQVSRWRLEREERESHPRRAVPARPNVVTISHALGTRGAEIAAEVGRLLGVPVYDRQIVKHLANTAHVHVETVETLDERAKSRLDDYLLAIQRERNFDQSDYFKALTRTVGALWEHGPCVLVGHGSVHIVAREYALPVRIVAPEDYRMAVVAEREHLTRDEVRRRVERTDAERESFHRRFFRAAVNDPLNYDLILNTPAFGAAGCAVLIAEAYRRKFAGRG